MPDLIPVQIERLNGKVQRLEQDAERREHRAAKVTADLERLRRAVEEQERELDVAKKAAEAAQAELAARREDEEAQKRLVAKIAKYAQYIIGAIVLIVTAWTGGVKSTIDWVFAAIRDLR